MEYITINAHNLDRFNRKVEKHLEQGWRLRGEVKIIVLKDELFQFFQTMVRSK